MSSTCFYCCRSPVYESDYTVGLCLRHCGYRNHSYQNSGPKGRGIQGLKDLGRIIDIPEFTSDPLKEYPLRAALKKKLSINIIPHSMPVTDICVSVRKNFIVTCSDDNVLLWDLTTKMIKFILFDFFYSSSSIYQRIDIRDKRVLISEEFDFLVVTGGFNEIKIVNYINKKEKNISGHNTTVDNICLCSKDKLLISTSAYTLIFSDTIKLENIKIIKISEAQFKKNNPLFLQKSKSNIYVSQKYKPEFIQCFNKNTYEVAFTIPSPFETMTFLKTDKENKYLAAAYEPNLLILYCAFESLSPTALVGHSKNIFCLHFFKTNFLLSGGLDNYFLCWDLFTKSCIKKIEISHSGIISSALLNEKTLILSSAKVGLFTFNLDTNLKSYFSGHSDRVLNVHLSRSLKYLATGSCDGSIMLWNLKDSQNLKAIGHDYGVTCIYISDSDSFLLSGSIDLSLKVWDARDMSCVHVFDGFELRVVEVVTSNYDRVVMARSLDDCVKVWDIGTQRYLGGFYYDDKGITVIKRMSKSLKYGIIGTEINLIIFRLRN